MCPSLHEPVTPSVACPIASTAATQETVAMRDFQRLIADIQRARTALEQTDDSIVAIPLDAVVGIDPRD